MKENDILTNASSNSGQVHTLGSEDEGTTNRRQTNTERIQEGASSIQVWGARVHNLKNVDVLIPRNSLTVITGLSG